MGGRAASARRAAEGGAASLTPRRHRGHRRARTHHTSNTHSGARSAESDTRGAVRWRPRLLAENTTRAQLRALHAQSPVRTPQRLGPRVCVAGRSSPHVPLSKLRAPSPWSWRRVLRVSRLGRQPARTQLPGVVSSELRSLPRPHRGQGCPALLGRLWPATSQGLRSRPPRSNPQVLVCMVGRRGQALKLLSSQIPLLPRLPSEGTSGSGILMLLPLTRVRLGVLAGVLRSSQLVSNESLAHQSLWF